MQFMEPLPEVDALIGEMETIIERVIRGGGASNPIEATLKATQLFEMLSNVQVRESFLKLTEAERNERMNVAVRLHNKVRTFTQVAYAELKARTKACAAFFLYVLNTENPKASVRTHIIRLLGRACQEIQPYSEITAHRCCEGAIKLYNPVNMEDFSRHLPPLELVDMKNTIFQAYIDQANLLVRNGDMEQIRKSIAGANEIVQSLPDVKKMQFARELIQLGSQLSSMVGAVQDAAYLLQTATNCLDLLWSTASAPPAARVAIDNPSPASLDELLTLKIKAQLGLAYCFKEMK